MSEGNGRTITWGRSGGADNYIASIVVNSLLLSRQAMINQTLMDPSGRDLDRECGYPVGDVGPDVYNQLYERIGVAHRIVNVYPAESWSIYPELYEREEETLSPFEEKWNQLLTKQNLWHYLERIDELSGIGHYGVMLLGLADLGAGDDLSKPAPGVGDDGNPTGVKVENELLYIRVFDESKILISGWETNPGNPRFGQPTEYTIVYINPVTQLEPAPYTFQLKVHWSRIIHVADNRKSSEIFGLPRMRPVLDRIYDVRKILGGSGEMFWRGAFPGYSFEAQPDIAVDLNIDEQSIKQQFDEYSSGLKRYLALIGVTAKSLAPQIGDPTNHLTQNYVNICATLGVPVRVFLGSEAGHLASTQDAQTWNRRLGKRQHFYIEPMLINPLVDRLIMVGVLPPTEQHYKTSWTDLNSLTAADQADVALKRTQAIMSYVAGGCEKVMPPLEFLTLIMGMTPEEARMIIKKASRKGRKLLTEGVVPSNNPQGGGRLGNPPQEQTGRPPTGPDGQPAP